MPAPGELTFVAPRGAKKPPRHLADLTPAERREAVAALGEKPFRAGQVSRHYFARYADDPVAWTDIPAAAREKLAAGLLPDLMSVVRHISCDDDTTRKTLWRLFDGTLVESVLMRYPDRVTMCVSSQAGCGMNCPFCATGQAGLDRNLSTAEIVHQIVDGMRALRDGEFGGSGPAAQPQPAAVSPEGKRSPGGPARLSNIVFMGMGEPLANYNRVVGAIRRLTDPEPDGLGLSQRGITVSTVGLVPAMLRFADEGFKCRLAVSLHAPDDELRDTLVPVNTRWKVREVLDAAWEYAEKSGRRISIEYALIRDINDQAWRADLLGRLLKGHRVHVNLIPLNPTPGSKWTASRPEDEKAFVAALEAHGVPVTVRDTRGQEIDGACGQLAASER
ncbi:23S rRNA (adenine(2503)-C(2))-methyltransferase RlmN [Streptomyces sp. 7N604]|uniref:23S rRNA (adenine(2503)-C(2))-methyltransferase RlmN n=1 Tax=Streptomyces sp. 7N604 TaxID=3457415 RepID=UPI003FD1F121